MRKSISQKRNKPSALFFSELINRLVSEETSSLRYFSGLMDGAVRELI